MELTRMEENLLSRLDRLPMTPIHIRILVLLVLAWIVEAFDIGIVGSAIVALKSLWHLSASQLGILGISSTLGIAIGLIPSGMLADRFGRRGVVLFGVAIFGVFTLVSAFTPNFWAVVILRGIAGLGEGAVFPIPYLMLAEFVNTNRRGLSVGVSNGILTAAYVLPSIAGSWALSAFPLNTAWRVPFLVGGIIPVLLLGPLAWGLPESPRFLLKQGYIDEVRAMVEAMERLAGLPHDETLINPRALYILQETGQRRVSARMLFRAPYLGRSAVSWLAYMGTLFMWYTMLVYSPLIFHQEGFQLGNAVLLTGLLMVVAGIGDAIQGFLSDWYGRKLLYGVYGGIAVIGLLLLGFHPQKAWVIGAGLLTFFFGLGIYPVAKLYIAEQYPTRLRGAGSAWGEMVGRTVSGVGFAYFVPALLAAGGVRLVFGLVAGLVAVLIAPVMIWGRETARISVEEAGTDLELDQLPSGEQIPMA